MAVEHGILDWSWPAVADLSAFQYYPVALTTTAEFPNGAITTISSTDTQPLGILQDTPEAAGVMGNVRLLGISKCRVYTGAVGVLDAIGVNANGVGAVTTTDNQWIVGRALDTSSDTGQTPLLTIEVQVRRY